MRKRRDRRYIIPAVLSEIDPPLLKRLLERHPGARHLLPTRARPIDREKIGQALINPPDDGTLTQLVREVGMLAELADAHYHDMLLRYVKEFFLLPGTPPSTADLAAILLLDRRELFSQAYAERAFREHSSFVSYFPAEHHVPEIKRSPKEALAALARDINAWLVASGRFAGAQVYCVETDEDFVVVVGRPEANRRDVKVTQSGEREPIEYQPEGFDLLQYRRATGELRTHTKLKSDLGVYMRLLGEHVFGDPDLYSTSSIAANLNLDLLRDGEAELACGEVPELREVRLTAMSWRYAMPSSLTTRHTSKHNLYEDLRSAGIAIPRGTALTTATLRFEFRDGHESSARMTAPNKLSISNDADHDTVCDFLRQRGVMLDPKEPQFEYARAALAAS